jgi:SAM-dependent methyltransferase
MSETPMKPDYGLDSPGLVRGIAAFGGIALAGSVLIRVPPDLWLLQMPLISLQWSGLFSSFQAGLMYYSSRVGKLKERETIINSIPWQGDERVLDVGCGRGLLMIAAAHRLTTGKAVGVDVWRSGHLSDNWSEGTWDNARLEGVEEKVEVETGDVRELPFEAESFDVVLSSLTLNHLPKAIDRSQAIEEMIRVLKPGGRLVILDSLYTGDYVRVLRAEGLKQITRSGLRFRVFPPARMISATKSPVI